MPRKKKSVVATSPSPSALLVDIPTAAQILASTRWAVRELLWSREIPHIKVGRRFLIDPADLRAFVDRRKAEAA